MKPPNDKALNATRLWIDCGIEQGYLVHNPYIITHRQSQRPGYTEWYGFDLFNFENLFHMLFHA